MTKILFTYFVTALIFINTSYGVSAPECPVGTYSNTTQYLNSTITLKILLIEFSDIKHRNQTDDNLPAYTFDDFENLLFSSGIYASPNKYSPDGESLFGSLHDYYNIMSDANLNITGFIVNSDIDNDNVPDWIQLNHTKSYYQAGSYTTFYNACISKANSAGLNISGLGSNVKLVIIYAGMMYRTKLSGTGYPGIVPRAVRGDNYYIMSEKFVPGSPYNTERSESKFSNIGTHAHELGHLLGFPDLYYYSNNNGNWDLMGAGSHNGPGGNDACPAPLNPQLRYLKGWISLDPVTSDQTYQADYYLQDPEIFKITNNSNSNEYFLIECRRFNRTMVIGSTNCPDYNNYVPHGSKTQGIVVWRINSSVSHGRIIHANGLQWPSDNHGNEGDLFPDDIGVEVLSPWSYSSTDTWVPNTKPSTNCGMEIISTGSGYYQIDIYSQYPEDASPSFPKNFAASFPNNGNPTLTWDANTEPDLYGYRVYKKLTTVSSGTQTTYDFTTGTSYTDNDFTVKRRFGDDTAEYWVVAVDSSNKLSVETQHESTSGTSSIQWKANERNEAKDIVEKYDLFSNYPNPFNPSTQITYQIPKDGFVSLVVYNSLGQVVKTLVERNQTMGKYNVSFDAADLPSGVYFYRLQAGNFVSVKKMLLLR